MAHESYKTGDDFAELEIRVVTIFNEFMYFMVVAQFSKESIFPLQLLHWPYKFIFKVMTNTEKSSSNNISLITLHTLYLK